jgi:hypothetical protein
LARFERSAAPFGTCIELDDASFLFTAKALLVQNFVIFVRTTMQNYHGDDAHFSPVFVSMNEFLPAGSSIIQPCDVGRLSTWPAFKTEIK